MFCETAQQAEQLIRFIMRSGATLGWAAELVNRSARSDVCVVYDVERDDKETDVGIIPVSLGAFFIIQTDVSALRGPEKRSWAREHRMLFKPYFLEIPGRVL